MGYFDVDSVLKRAIDSRICELEGLDKTLGINYDCEIDVLEKIKERLNDGAKIVSRETMCKSIIDWFQHYYDEEW